MNDSTKSPPRHFTGVHWLRSKIPLSELHKNNCLLRIRHGDILREGVFTLEARAHPSFPEYHHISAEHTFMTPTRGVTTLVTFDQHRADQIRRSTDAPEDYNFVADIDAGRPLEYVQDIQDAVEKHLLEVLKRIQS